jgi:hypothetical protein
MSEMRRKNGKYWNLLGLFGIAFAFLAFMPAGNFMPSGNFTPSGVFPSPPGNTLPTCKPNRDLPTITANPAPTKTSTPTAFSLADSSRLNLIYDNLNLDSMGLSPDAFHKAVEGFLSMVLTGEVHNPGILSIIDFTLPSNQKRLFVLDLFNGRLLFNTLVAHGRNSGRLIANKFSNRYNSYMSSLGFYLTGDPFIGQHGYSLRLDGKEKGWNDNVSRRAIIMHPADYVSEDYIRQQGHLGRSEGCPAIPEKLDRPIIDSIRGGSCLFIYAPNRRYLHRSKLLS